MDMRKITVINQVTLDGVMQAPARPDEDTRDGFKHGGWAIPNVDQVMGEAMGRRMAAGEGHLLLGRWTYESLYDAWHVHRPEDPMTARLESSRKYVVSSTLTEPLVWANSTLLSGDAGDAVAELKQEPGPDIGMLGSGELIHALMARGLIDGLVLLIHPVVLGSGRRLFVGGEQPAEFRLTDSVVTTKGVVIATYERR
jgi:dihydrofolate reductase